MAGSPGHLIDIMATCVDVGGATYPTEHNGNQITPLEGKSLAGVFDTGSREEHDALYWEHEGNRAVRQGNWKLVSRWNKEDGGQWELYDLKADRTEMKNLAAGNASKVAELRAMYDAWAARANVVPWRLW
jgi:arylsulfatase